MNHSHPPFETLQLDRSNTVSWIHIGDTHLTHTGEQNEIDLGRIIDEINAVYAGCGVDFVFVPGYPSDLKQGCPELTKLLHRYPVLLVDMGHTHYNEISNDGQVLFTATRSTGQIEEGPTGYSLTTLDGPTVSWHFIPLGAPSLVAITNPSDQRLLTAWSGTHQSEQSIPLHAKVWSPSPIASVHAHLAGHDIQLHHTGGAFWSADLDPALLKNDDPTLTVLANDSSGGEFSSSIRLNNRSASTKVFAELDQDNAIGKWEERGILGTQLGPNNNGRNW